MRTRFVAPHTLAGVALAGVLVAGLALPALAGPPGRGPGFPLRRALRQLDLSDAQKEQLRTAREAQRPAFEELRGRMRTDREALKGLLAAPAKDYDSIGKAVVRLDETRKALKAEREKAKATLERVLTPEQRSKLESFSRGFHAGRRAGFGRGPAGRPGPGGPGGSPDAPPDSLPEADE